MNFQPVSNEMTHAEERGLEMGGNGLTYCIMETTTVRNNKKPLEATFLRTEKKLAKEPEWKVAYAAQAHGMIHWKAAL